MSTSNHRDSPIHLDATTSGKENISSRGSSFSGLTVASIDNRQIHSTDTSNEHVGMSELSSLTSGSRTPDNGVGALPTVIVQQHCEGCFDPLMPTITTAPNQGEISASESLNPTSRQTPPSQSQNSGLSKNISPVTNSQEIPQSSPMITDGLKNPLTGDHTATTNQTAFQPQNAGPTSNSNPQTDTTPTKIPESKGGSNVTKPGVVVDSVPFRATSNPEPSSSSNGNQSGTIALVILTVFFVILILGLFYWRRKRRHQINERKDVTKEMEQTWIEQLRNPVGAGHDPTFNNVGNGNIIFQNPFASQINNGQPQTFNESDTTRKNKNFFQLGGRRGIERTGRPSSLNLNSKIPKPQASLINKPKNIDNNYAGVLKLHELKNNRTQSWRSSIATAWADLGLPVKILTGPDDKKDRFDDSIMVFSSSADKIHSEKINDRDRTNQLFNSFGDQKSLRNDLLSPFKSFATNSSEISCAFSSSSNQSMTIPGGLDYRIGALPENRTKNPIKTNSFESSHAIISSGSSFQSSSDTNLVTESVASTSSFQSSNLNTGSSYESRTLTRSDSESLYRPKSLTKTMERPDRAVFDLRKSYYPNNNELVKEIM
ncbi:expressed protein [Phakopsora pachyrhizi]|uniref:Expressed protein n=1 Tax=Phakopsora pachyrhizi TaxID=170000 RepID=A0AAV0BIK4_PHAPC|nr:expressed protein [Phakopsora pachyrhizi]